MHHHPIPKEKAERKKNSITNEPTTDKAKEIFSNYLIVNYVKFVIKYKSHRFM